MNAIDVGIGVAAVAVLGGGGWAAYASRMANRRDDDVREDLRQQCEQERIQRERDNAAAWDDILSKR